MLYPEIESYYNGFLDVTHNHRLHFQLAGNPDGIPVVFLHGGPGAGIPLGFARFFDPNLYKIISMDQRGCGLSTPLDDLSNNTTQYLIDDFHSLREHLNIDKWVIFGGSWGATLGLLLAIDAPERVSAIVLRGTFLGRQQDIDWFLSPNGGAAALFPEHYLSFTKHVPNAHNTHALCQFFMSEFTSKNELRKTAAIHAWYQWEEKISCLTIPPHYSTVRNTPLNKMTNMAVLECHYLLNKCFISENYILENIAKIESIPGIIIHGRYDSICNVSQSHDLHVLWKNSELNIVPAAGHSTAEPAICAALCQAMRHVAKFLKQ